MKRSTYQAITSFMMRYMGESAHDAQHVFRVVNSAMDIATHEPGADLDVLLAAALLHDIGRDQQAHNPDLCHAQTGAEMAYTFLTGLGWPREKAQHVRQCILSHRFRHGHAPATLEAKILFDADKLDVVGPIGVARTLLFEGHVNDEPLYRLDETGRVCTGPTGKPSFFRAYDFKLRDIADAFYTQRARELAQQYQAAGDAFYTALLGQINDGLNRGRTALDQALEEETK